MATTITIDASQEGSEPTFSMQNHSEGLWRQTQNEYVETHEGIKHRFQDVTLEDEHLEGHFDFNSYAADLRVAYPQLDAAINWAAKGNAHGFDVAAFNAAVDSENLSDINAGADRLVAMYLEATNTPEVANDSHEEDDSNEAVSEWFDNLSDDFIDNTLDDISNASYTPDQVDAFEELAQSYDDSSIEAAILSLGASIGRGELSGDDAIAWALENFSEADLAAAYVQLSHQLN